MDIYFQEAVLPAKTKSFVVTMLDGSYTVLLNADLCLAATLEAADHEVRHILDKDFEGVDVNQIELRAHAKGGKHEALAAYFNGRIAFDPC